MLAQKNTGHYARLTVAGVEMSPELPSPDELRAEYRRRKHGFARLLEEANWELQEALQQSPVKLHSVTSRLKSEDSFVEKVARKSYTDPWTQTDDLVGLRVVCLFRSDLASLETLIRDRFKVIGAENTVEGGARVDQFGYMSVHFTCEIKEEYTGSRYDAIKGRAFEIQLRTILMDAWDNVSHHLDYKGESSIPSELRRDFYALSGLFYIADQHFELFFGEARAARETAAELVTEADHGLDVEINLDTMLAYLSKRYSDRQTDDAASVSEIVEEVTAHGFTRLDELDEALTRVEPSVLSMEKSIGRRQRDFRFTRVGMVRLSLTYVSN